MFDEFTFNDQTPSQDEKIPQEVTFKANPGDK
jgi:hypothetical protein